MTTPSSPPVLSQINVFPIKSTAGIRLSHAWVERQGIVFDRRFMVANLHGEMITARTFPQLVNVQSALLADGLHISLSGKPPLVLKYAELTMQPVSSTVWGDNFTAYTTTSQADQWFSDIIGQPVQVLFTGEQSQRIRPKRQLQVSFADGYPLLLISEASLAALNIRSTEHHTMAQFRPNIVVKDTDAFAEDGWQRIRIGEVEFEIVKPCARCTLTTIDPNNATPSIHKEPLKTLSQFRADETGEVFFGQNVIALNEGMIREDDKVEVLATQPKPIYTEAQPDAISLTCVAREVIAQHFTTFWFEPTDPQHTLPTYLAGQHIPIHVEINGDVLTRYYTLSSSPSRPGRYAISVKRVDGGCVSNRLAEHFQIGDTLIAEKPSGDFHLGVHTQKLLLLSAGSGITPMLSMLRYLSDHDQIRDVVFYHQCRTSADIPYWDELKALEEKHPSLDLRIVLTQPDRTWRGETGRLRLQHLAMISDLEQRQVFVCGPAPFMTVAKTLLLNMGMALPRYHQESFGGGGVLPQATKAAVSVTINEQQFQGNDQATLLEQAETAGITMDYRCRAGLCGACKVTLQSGEVEQPDSPALSEQERADGKILACCCIPKKNVVIYPS